MKHFIATIILAFCAIVAFSQEHITFKGVPVDGTLSEYVKNMQAKGFKYEGKSEDGIAVLTGDFAGYKGCIIGVSTLDNFDVVSRIVVSFPEDFSWGSLLYKYDDLKSMLSEKYGEPQECVETFNDDYVTDDGSKLSAVKLNRCDYYCVFETALGIIELEIMANRKMSCFVRLSYNDRINSSKARQAAMADL